MMKLSDFDFNLPAELIAQFPSKKRDHSSLLIEEVGNIIKTEFYNILNYLLPGDLLVFNNSKVIKAGLSLKKNGKKININLNKKIENNRWLAFAKPARKLIGGDEFHFDSHKLVILRKLDMGEIEIEFKLNNISVFDFLEKYGQMPLPSYIKRLNPVEDDKERYQTVYSQIMGSVAAPTAGLHFTQELLNKIRALGVQVAFVTLHVGAGTFLPVKSENIDEHKMHSEYYSIDYEDAELINRAKRENRRVIAVGTTTLRALESAVFQGNIRSGQFETNIFIKPGFKFQVVDMLITNFHLPKSTLFILVCAFAGYEKILKLYEYAIANKMRFFSYGDAMFLYGKR